MNRDINSKHWRLSKEGHLIHDGDCRFWSWKIFTCGLLKHMAYFQGSVVTDLYPDFDKDSSHHCWSTDIVQRVRQLGREPEPQEVDTTEVRRLMQEAGWIVSGEGEAQSP